MSTLDLRVEEIDGVLHCSLCGPLPQEPEEGLLKNSAWNHLLDAHRQRMVTAHSEAAIRRAL